MVENPAKQLAKEAASQPKKFRPLQTAIGGLASSMSAGVMQVLTQTLAVSVLSRLLTPTEFGIVAPLVAMVGILTIVAEGGMGAALINTRENLRKFYANAFGISLIVSCVLALGVVLLAPLLVVDSVSGADTMLRVLALLLILQPFATLQQSIQLKELNFKTVAMIDVTCSVVASALVPILLALLGFGAWSLIIGQLSRPILRSAICLVLSGPPPLPRIDRDITVDMLKFSGWFTLTKVSAGILLQGDRIVMSNFQTPATVGLYGRAQNLVQLTLDAGASSLDRVLFPMFSKAETMEATTRWYLASVAFVAALMAPLAIAVGFSAPFLVWLVLGPTWGATAEILTVLSPLILLRSLDRSAASLLRRSHWVRTRALTQISVAAVMVVMVVLASPYGVLAVASAVLAANILSLVLNQANVGRALELPLPRQLGVFLPAIRSSVLVGTIYIAFYLLFPGIYASFLALTPAAVSGVLVLGLWVLKPTLMFGEYGDYIVRIKTMAMNVVLKRRSKVE